MGLYTINCSICDEPFRWFSGNKQQTCEKCVPINIELKPDKHTITKEQKAQLIQDLTNNPDKKLAPVQLWDKDEPGNGQYMVVRVQDIITALRKAGFFYDN